MPIVVTPTIYEADEFIDVHKPIIVDNVELHKEKVTRLFGQDIDLKSFYISLFAILLAFLVWYQTGLLYMGIADSILIGIFIFLISNFIIQIFTSSKFAGSITLEQSKLVLTEQINAMLLGSLLVFVFIVSTAKGQATKSIKDISRITLMLILLNSMNLSVKKEGGEIRTLRKLKETVLNISIALFTSMVYLSISS